MIKIETYSSTGRKLAQTTLPKKYETPINAVLLAQALRVYEDRKHKGSSKVKTRGEVVASTRKIYRQKGTGRARHGARSAPIFVGGGVAHGPKGVKRMLSLPKVLAKKALNVSLSLKAKKGRVCVIDGISDLKKTKQAANLLSKISKSNENVAGKARFTLALSHDNKESVLVFRNLADVGVVRFKDLNAHKVYYGGTLLIDKNVFDDRKAKKTRKSSHKKSVKSKKVKKATK
jgi:large subunit ribosomal protein L4